MELAVLSLPRLDVLELAERLTHAGHVDTAARLLIADACREERVALSLRDREAVISVLRDAPAGLCELRGALLGEQVGRALGTMA